jgi:integrase
MATVFRITKRTVRGAQKFVLDLRSIGQGREFFDDRDLAETRLFEIQNKGLEAANLSARDRHEFLEAKRILLPLGATVRQAAEFYVQHNRAREQKAMAEAVAIFLATKIEKKRRAKYTDNLRYDLNSFRKACGDVFCHEVSQVQVETWLRSNGWQPKTQNQKLINVRTFFSFCLKRGWVIASSCAGIERASVDHKTPGILTVDQCKRLIQATRKIEPGMLPYVSLALFAGIRPAEILRLSWSKIDAKEGTVRIDGDVAKTRQRRVVHLAKNARAWLALGGDLPPAQWQDRLDRIRAAAGFAYSILSRRKGEKSRRIPGDPWQHDCLRHSFVSYSIPIHGISETAREAGHSESELHRSYKDLVSKSSARAFWSIMP